MTRIKQWVRQWPAWAWLWLATFTALWVILTIRPSIQVATSLTVITILSVGHTILTRIDRIDARPMDYSDDQDEDEGGWCVHLNGGPRDGTSIRLPFGPASELIAQDQGELHRYLLRSITDGLCLRFEYAGRVQ